MKLEGKCALVVGGGIIDASGPYPFEDFRRAVEMNLLATFNLNRMEAWAMYNNEPEDGERGVLINRSSISAFAGPVGRIHYSSSKAGVAALNPGVAKDLGAYGIRCMAIAPSLFETGLVKDMGPEDRAKQGTEAVFPRRPGQPEEFAHLVKAVIENPMLNGDTIRLDADTRRTFNDNLHDPLY